MENILAYRSGGSLLASTHLIAPVAKNPPANSKPFPKLILTTSPPLTPTPFNCCANCCTYVASSGYERCLASGPGMVIALASFEEREGLRVVNSPGRVSVDAMVLLRGEGGKEGRKG